RNSRQQKIAIAESPSEMLSADQQVRFVSAPQQLSMAFHLSNTIRLRRAGGDNRRNNEDQNRRSRLFHGVPFRHIEATVDDCGPQMVIRRWFAVRLCRAC